MKRIIFIAIVWLSLFSTPTLANQCLNYLNFVQGSCGSYTYDPITVNFRDLQGIEQSVTVHRIYNNSGIVVQADLDFKVNCPGGCVDREQAITSALWAFREAYLQDKFYVVTFSNSSGCDPHEEICCDDVHCMEIYGDTQPSSVSRTNEAFAKPARPGRKKAEDYIPIADSSLNLYDRAVKDSRNEAEFRQEVVAEQQVPPRFVVTINNSGGHQVCVLEGDNCKVLSGHISVTDDSASVGLEHNYGHNFNRELDAWLKNWFSERSSPMVCNQRMECDVGGKHCQVIMSCSAP